MGYFCFGLFGLGIILIISASVGKKKNSRCTAQTQGTQINILERYNSEGALPNTNVYSYYVNGTEYQIKSTAINNQVKNIGDTCTIWYNPSKPKEAQEFHYDSENKIYKIINLIGIILVLLTFIIPVVYLYITSR